MDIFDMFCFVFGESGVGVGVVDWKECDRIFSFKKMKVNIFDRNDGLVMN